MQYVKKNSHPLQRVESNTARTASWGVLDEEYLHQIVESRGMRLESCLDDGRQLLYTIEGVPGEWTERELVQSLTH